MQPFNKYAEKGAYHWKEYADVNNKYHKHANRVREWVTEKKVLDVGAGDGLITSLLGAQGIEYEALAVELGRVRGVNIIQGDAYELPFPDDSFEAVTMIDVLEHFEFPEKALAESHRVAPVLYVNTPPKKDDGTLTDKYHIQEWSPKGLVDFVEKNGYVLDGCVTVYPKEKLMYAKFTRI